MGIPKITHQIWMQGFENIPDKFKKNVEQLHTLNPEYTHMQWNEADLRKECLKYSAECAERFDSFDLMILKVDLGRYVVLYNYGGISIDTDMAPLKPLSNTPGINNDIFMISMSAFPLNMLGKINNAVILTPVQNELLKKIIDTIISEKKNCDAFITKEMCVENITGPLFINDIIYNSKLPYKIMNNKYYEPCFNNDVMCSINKNSIMDHKHEGSWVSPIFTYLGGAGTLLLRLSPFIITGGIVYMSMFKNSRGVFIKGKRK